MHSHVRQQLQQTEEGQRDGVGREFRDHAIAFATVNGGLIALNLATSPGYLWALWPFFGWGIGFLSHAVGTYRTLRAERAQGSLLAAPPPPSPLALEAERERPWPDLEER